MNHHSHKEDAYITRCTPIEKFDDAPKKIKEDDGNKGVTKICFIYKSNGIRIKKKGLNKMGIKKKGVLLISQRL